MNYEHTSVVPNSPTPRTLKTGFGLPYIADGVGTPGIEGREDVGDVAKNVSFSHLGSTSEIASRKRDD